MSTNHFSALTEAEQERLAFLIEECAEVIQQCGKVLLHGYDNNGKMPVNNRELLAMELGHVVYAINMLTAAKDVNEITISWEQRSKEKNIVPYLHHQDVQS
jgi:hypothetical protein